MNNFSEAVPSQWTEQGVLVVSARERKPARDRRLVKDTLLSIATATAVGFCSISGISLRQIEISRAPTQFAITVPTSRLSTSSAGGEIDPMLWGRAIQRLRLMKKVEAERDFNSEPEPFI